MKTITSTTVLSAAALAANCLFFTLAHASGAQTAGASTPFVTVEAESGHLDGGATLRALPPGAPVPKVATLELEASGGAFVELTHTGQSVSIVNPVANANTVVIRASIPTTADTTGQLATINLYVNGVFRQAVTLSSKQSWQYHDARTHPRDPNAGGVPFHFYEENRAFITGAPIPAGSVITLKKDAGNLAEVYGIDSVDFESVAAPRTQPANSLSVTDYGADPTFGTDSTAAIQRCINDARARSMSVWIPPGKYRVSSLASGGLDMTGVTVNGAGMWYSTIYRNVPLPPPSKPWRSNIKLGTNSVIRNVSIDSNAIYRGIGGDGGDDYGLLSQGNNWLIERVWIQHCDAQWLSGSNGTIRDSRVADSWGDGINLNNGNTLDPQKLGVNLTAQNNFVRGTGDDGIATYSDAGAAGTNSQMDGTKIINNTSVAPYWANGLRIAGGKHVLVQGNRVQDPSSGNGMDVSIFGATGQPLESGTITGNLVLRGGGWDGTDRHGMHVGSSNTKAAPTNVEISNNVIQDSRRAGLKIGTVTNILDVHGNTIVHPATQGVWIAKGVSGSGNFVANTVTNPNAGQTVFQNDSPATFGVTQSGNSWD
ncbi:right-handed parallel beta-helix repeat-containing protein [Pandoraea anhela]|uniref:Uncharacterized protein n=1 Tax=Pandoraea anhela TaxID=2508295 RepID=A0A5E4Z542_9BURK|nr:glycosyl hydrolase family 28-related protein [Pandoraea anhela]VVE55787.1 hypothetical protein PAN31108_05035 [Pandoraea anhela]